MRICLLVVLCSSLVAAAAGVPSPLRIASPVTDLAPGDPAPQFALSGSDGQMYRLQDYKGKQAVVLAWFAKAFTGG